ncbi:MAG: Sporulation initiation phosphotransferase F [Pelotomaculum sp. PtaB.Bin013]|uniref:Stage 0 sporulation protein A homolog n=1 Tax=Pelotomaculum isophthalicicum JI TaxID=947010 RepID=A0A9X4H5R4_9FIRM|nr:response regulator [Pelotomaculum isophthalicicum]MDF9407859.1 response regulator [Pelotomaculum isophthalicicum JI]OPX91066.1 MAG: Sporulation initiation phosphotransferase F [Pelotomaculum sp. PtaB.Bin013]
MSQSSQYLLIVDDNVGVCRLLFELFSDEGYIVETALSGAEALRIVCGRTPSLILLDVKMPGMSGLETLDKIKEIVPDIPVVMMTAYTELDTIMAAQKDGLIQHYLGKPFDLDDIRRLVKKILLDRECEQKVTG